MELPAPPLRLVADSPAAAAVFAAADTVRSMPDEALPAPWRVACAALMGGDARWLAALRDADAPAGAEHPVVVVDHAPTSQFGVLQAQLRGGARLPDHLTAIALAGDAFRGQRGRSWQALRGNLHLCRVARLDVPAAGVQAALSALPAVAAARAVERASAGRVIPGIKWVNDLIVADHKVGGVISATHVHGDVVGHLLVGIGINVTAAPSVPRDPRVPAAGALAALAGDDAPGLRQIAIALLHELDRAIDDLVAGRGADLVAAYQERSMVVGRDVAIWPVAEDAPAGEPLARGRVLAVRDDLGLELEGHAVTVYAGRLTLLDG